MTFHLLPDFPKPETEPTFDWTVFSHQNNEQQLNYLIYATQRDFLSTPRSFAVLQLSNNDASAVNYTWFEQETYFELLQINSSPLESGFYQTCDQSGNNLYLLVINSQLMEIAVDNVQLVKRLYHHSDTKSALLSLLE